MCALICLTFIFVITVKSVMYIYVSTVNYSWLFDAVSCLVQYLALCDPIIF